MTFHCAKREPFPLYARNWHSLLESPSEPNCWPELLNVSEERASHAPSLKKTNLITQDLPNYLPILDFSVMFLYFLISPFVSLFSFFFFSLCLLNFFPPCYNGCILESVLSQVEFYTSFDNGWSPVNISAIREVCQVSCLILSGRQRRAAFMRGEGGVPWCWWVGSAGACLEELRPHLALVPRRAGFSPTYFQPGLACREAWPAERESASPMWNEAESRGGGRSFPHSCDFTLSLPSTACAFQTFFLNSEILSSLFIYFKNLFINLFIFGCFGSSLLRAGFL